MQLSIGFNWPPGEESASIQLGTPNVVDNEYEFRIGVVTVESPDLVAWHVNGWLSPASELFPINFTARKSDTVIVERRPNGATDPDTRNDWRISDEWPAEAQGPTMVHATWTF